MTEGTEAESVLIPGMSFIPFMPVCEAGGGVGAFRVSRLHPGHRHVETGLLRRLILGREKALGLREVTASQAEALAYFAILGGKTCRSCICTSDTVPAWLGLHASEARTALSAPVREQREGSSRVTLSSPKLVSWTHLSPKDPSICCKLLHDNGSKKRTGWESNPRYL